ncbi:hypothetical protein [Elizabethkingia miricola]|uniref:Uncharacterized protein n=1 Tax=Elizabethkingia miricola TaxID=172045 RepID=A0ABD5BB55_ELIMR|nr:hypothetical protein [Elizabethkingia miricola]MDQ8750906.1 hypothetical protein [Elizabethkingia miricola]
MQQKNKSKLVSLAQVSTRFNNNPDKVFYSSKIDIPAKSFLTRI